eukprot:scaffold168176_cov34-Prasinocladus_malaysianus.AAC.1
MGAAPDPHVARFLLCKKFHLMNFALLQQNLPVRQVASSDAIGSAVRTESKERRSRHNPTTVANDCVCASRHRTHLSRHRTLIVILDLLARL